MGALYSLIFGKKEQRVPRSAGAGITNALKNSWRGLVATVLALILFAVFFDPIPNSSSTLTGIWLIMFVFMLVAPMPASASALIPIFCVPIFGVMSSKDTCGALISEHIALFFLGGWLLLLFNNCGLDKRLICAIMAQGGTNAFKPKRLLLKACVAAFASSAFSERELATQALMGYIVSALGPLQLIKTEGDYDKFKNILCMSVAVSSLIGSMCFMHASLTTLQLRSLYHTHFESQGVVIEWPDVFNFYDYGKYAIPVTILMMIFNTLYEAVLVSRCTKRPMSVLTQQALQKTFKKNFQDLGPMTNHQKVSIFFYILYMLFFSLRWSHTLQKGWASFSVVNHATQPQIKLCGISDATVAAIFVVILHFLPKSFNFMKIWSVKRVGDLPQMKPESGILFWKYVDKHTDYSLFLVFGAGSIIYQGCVTFTDLNTKIANLGDSITGLHWNIGILIVVIFSILLGNLMTGMAAQACLMPFFLAMGQKSLAWLPRSHLVALGVGLGTGLGFCLPHRHTPSAFVRSVGKVKLKTQIIYSIGSSIICGVILWLSLCFLARQVWDDVLPIAVGIPVLKITTPATKPTTVHTDAATPPAEQTSSTTPKPQA